jgi:hypothetical protein
MTSDRLYDSVHVTTQHIGESFLVVLGTFALVDHRDRNRVRTIRKIFDADVVKLLDLLHDKLRLVDLEYKCGAAGISPRKSELAEGVFDGLWDIYCL